MNLPLILSFVAMVCYAGLAGLTMRRGLRVRVNRLFALYLVTMLAWQLGYILLSLSETKTMALYAYRLVATAAGGQCVVFFFFARSLSPTRERRGTIYLAFLAWLGTSIALFVDPGHVITEIHRNPVTGLLVPEFGPLLILVAGWNYVLLGLGVVALVRRYREARSELERNRLRYLLLAIVMILLGTLANFVPSLAAHPVDVAANIIGALLISYAILRYQLLDITFVVRRGLAYSILTAVIAATYLLGILAFERLARPGLGVSGFVVPVLLAMVAAILLEPWRDKAQAWVDRLLFREKYDARLMLQELSRQTTTIIDLETLGSLLLSQICEGMHIERAALFLREGPRNDFYIAAQRACDQEILGLRLGHDHPVVQWLLHSERPLRSQDLDTLPQFRSLWGQEREDLSRLGARLYVPLQVKNELVGILAVGAKLSDEAHSSDDEMTLSTLANQTAVAVENAHLFATTKARVAELTTLQEVGVRLVSARQLPTVLQVLVESGIQLLGAHEAHIALYDPVHERFGQARSLAASGAFCSFSADSAAGIPLMLAAHNEQPVVIGDLRLHTAIPPSLAREAAARAAAAYPLRRGESVIGVLAVTYHQPHSFTEDELRLLRMLSDQATLAIDNAQLLESEQARRQLADTLREVSRVVGSTLQLDAVLDLVLEQLQNVVNYDGAAILLLSDSQLEVSAARGSQATTNLIGRSFGLAELPILAELFHERKSVAIGDIRKDRRWDATPDGLNVRAFIGVPLMARDEVRGILAVGQSAPGYYNDDDLQNVVAFANQAALAIENARLYQETIVEKRKTETILAETFSGIVVTGVDLRILTFNSGAAAITGLSAEEAVGRRLPDVLGPEIAAPGSPLGRVMAERERVPPQETVIQVPSGVRDILQGTVALHDGQGHLFGYLLSFTDITRLKEVDRLKTDIVANVSHELRTPLASIKAYAELLLDNVEGDDHRLRDQFLTIIDQETDRLSQLIGDLLDLSRLEAGRFEVRKTVVDLGELLSSVLSLLDVQRRNREVTVRVKVPDGLPDLVADGDMVTIILRNLLTNAIKFSHPGGEVLVALHNSPEHLVLEVSDHGIGIPTDAIPHLFQKFYRVQSNVEPGREGTGLGLVLAKQAVEAHGGTIEVESQVDVGTTFTVRLPWE